ncbi:MAG: hypothetical protein ACE5I1_33260 [bacterium]
MGRLDDAIAQNRKTFEVDATWLVSLWRLAYLYAMKDDYAEALRLIEQLISMNKTAAPSSEKSYYDLLGPYMKGLLLMRVGRYAEANRIFSDFSSLMQSVGNSRYQAVQMKQSRFFVPLSGPILL